MIATSLKAFELWSVN